ncbi:MAG: S1 RNA-binding domain-containing protein [Parasporobacterium sp.]|nr:S1 RNA-binding domain-containing protein [Parasporobacterium sp.]
MEDKELMNIDITEAAQADSVSAEAIPTETVLAGSVTEDATPTCADQTDKCQNDTDPGDTAPTDTAPADSGDECPADTCGTDAGEKVFEEAPAEPEVIETMEDYKDVLESSLRKVYEGDTMEGEVIAFNEHGVILDLSYYATGRIPVEEMSADPSFNIMTDVHIGDRFSAIVKSVDDGHGNILLSKKTAESEYSWDKLKKYMEEETVISGTVTEVKPKGVIMYVEGIRGFIPASKLGVKYVEDTAPYLGKKLQVKVADVNEEAEKLILSAKEILTEEFVQQQSENISRLSVGSIVEGTVEKLQNYGAFVDIGDGISGLLHVSEISDKRINHPKAVLRVGQKVQVMITRIDNGKVSLSMKAVQAAEEQKLEEETPHEYHSEAAPNNPFADLLKNFMK